MSIDVATTIFRTVGRRGVVLPNGLIKTLKAAQLRIEQRFVAK